MGMRAKERLDWVGKRWSGLEIVNSEYQTAYHLKTIQGCYECSGNRSKAGGFHVLTSGFNLRGLIKTYTGMKKMERNLYLENLNKHSRLLDT
jgi:hypothetical protein